VDIAYGGQFSCGFMGLLLLWVFSRENGLVSILRNFNMISTLSHHHQHHYHHLSLYLQMNPFSDYSSSSSNGRRELENV
jgi:hypothetical protein